MQTLYAYIANICKGIEVPGVPTCRSADVPKLPGAEVPDAKKLTFRWTAAFVCASFLALTVAAPLQRVAAILKEKQP